MIILSFGDFYLGVDPDSAFYMDVQGHFGIFRLEFGHSPTHTFEPDTDTSNRCPDGENPSCI